MVSFCTCWDWKSCPTHPACAVFSSGSRPRPFASWCRLTINCAKCGLWCLPHPRTSLEFHLDSVVLTLYVANNKVPAWATTPKPKDVRPYHPDPLFRKVMDRSSGTGRCAPVTPGSNTGARHFVRRCLDKAPPAIPRSRIRFLADCGFFFRSPHPGFWIQWGCGYTIVCRSYQAYQQLAEKAGFQDLQTGWGFAEFEHRARRNGPKAHRFIAIRRPLPLDPEQAAQLTLFKDKHYSYSILVSNLGLTPWRTWTAYVERANIERSIRELLSDLALNKIPTPGAGQPTWRFSSLLLLAYNLVHWFKRLCLPQAQWGITVETLRHKLLAIPANLICRSGRNVLLLPRQYDHQNEFLAAAAKVSNLKSLKLRR